MNLIYKKEYYEHIQKYSKKFTEEQTTDLKISELIDIFFTQVTIEGKENFKKTINKIILNLSQFKVGIELFQRYIKINQKGCIKETNDTDSHFNKKSKTVFMNLQNRHFYLTSNSQGEREVAEGPIEVILAHEFTHFIHAFEDEEGHERRCSNSHKIANIAQISDFTTEEELLTIAGFEDVSQDTFLPLCFEAVNTFGKKSCFAFSDSLCENSFLACFNKPLRINHRGSPSEPTIIDFIMFAAIPNIKKYFELNPSDIKKTFITNTQTKGKDSNFIVSPLSIAAYCNHEDIVELLFSIGADKNIEDDFGGALQASIKNGCNYSNEFKLAHKLIDTYGVSPSLKDKAGKTVLENMTPSSKYCSIKRPLLEKIERLTLNLKP